MSKLDETKIERIKLTQGFEAVVDAEDYERVSQYKWYAAHAKSRHGKHVYATRAATPAEKESGWPSQVKMHRFLCPVKKGIYVDHINGDTLDNRKVNLRPCTLTENNRNARKRQGAVKYKGVRFLKSVNKFCSGITVNDKLESLGNFDTALEAAMAYDKAAIFFHGEFACLNFPGTTTNDALIRLSKENAKLRIRLENKSIKHDEEYRKLEHIHLLTLSKLITVEKDHDELREANANCISLSLHESRLREIEKERDDLRARLEKSELQQGQAQRESQIKLEAGLKIIAQRDAYKQLCGELMNGIGLAADYVRSDGPYENAYMEASRQSNLKRFKDILAAGNTKIKEIENG